MNKQDIHAPRTNAIPPMAMIDKPFVCGALFILAWK